MYLKRLVLLGFKSFADRTTFEFGPGMTCVVGPNGCGKSNLVDAVRWVLGEQSAKSLRGRQMADVIFNGSGTRKPTGSAQVDLVFDNSDNFFPIDHVEVSISRRLYRSGESEYLLNKQACRLKDIRELFLDTGIGVDAYSMIEQGKVDVLLQASPQERRAIFEEAAGISKYKVRRKETERKLERVDQNLLRVADIIDEVAKQLRSVKYQAGKARSYREYSGRLNELRATYVLAEFHNLSTRQQELQDEATRIGDQVTGLRSRISKLETRSSELTVEQGDLEQQIGHADNELLGLQSQITTLQERVGQHRDRLEEQRQVMGRARQRWWKQQVWAGQLAGDLRRRRDELGGLAEAQAQQQEQIEQLAQQDAELGRQLVDLSARLEDEKAGLIDLLRRTSQIGNEVHGLDVHRTNLAGHKDRLTARDAEIAKQLEAVLTEKAQLENRRAEMDALIKAQNEQLEARKTQASQLADRRDLLDSQLSAARERRGALRSRQDVVAEMIRSREGVSEAPRRILQRREADASGQTFPFVRGLVADLFEADGNRAALVEAALSPFEQYLVVSESKHLLDNPGQFADLGGRVQAFCLDRLGPFVDGRDFSQQEGFLAHLLDWVRYPEDCQHLARHLLGKTVVVDSMADALRLSETLPVGYRFITLDGQTVEPDGRVGLGSLGAQAGLITRRSELRELAGETTELEAHIAQLQQQRDDLLTEARHLERVQQELRTAIYEGHATRVEIDVRLRGSAEAIHRLGQEQPLVVGELEALERQISEAVRQQEEHQRSLLQLESQNSERQQRVDELNRQIEHLSQRRQQVGEELTRQRVSAGELGQKRSSLEQQIADTQQMLAEAEAAVSAAVGELTETTGRAERIERGILSGETRLAELFLDKERQHGAMLDLRRRRQLLLAELEQLGGQIKQARTELEQGDEELHNRRLQLQEIQVRKEGVVQRTRDELHIDLEQQYAEYRHEDRDWSAVESEIAELRGRIERLGNVNLDAIDQQAELEQRTSFLTEQRDDLEGSKRQLENLIARLNKESRERFETSFEQIRANFQDLFRKLFGGGRADIILENPDDVLDSGVEIIARPPGKELQSISLLSGGEKTLAAVALLLGIFKSKPSPFAMLDEVDAALDEANNERFNRVVREFLATSQFLVITHSKRTMSVADVLYGITMQEAGVSQPVSVRFEDESPRGAAVA
ncbi:MAG TPA: chromosome segregation protein SMC [Phycisphaerae bacterium]|nr:chromosome segregation protein SMC [Phycisphaerae bacterium]